MSLVVEDGSGKSDAQSYVSVADSATYAALISTLWGLGATTTAMKENALQLATQYIDLKYGQLFTGQKKASTILTQALEWPRSYVYDAVGNLLSDSAIPTQIKIATIELACAIIAGDSLMAASEDIGTIESESIGIGPLSVSTSFAGGKSTLKRYPKVEKLVAKFLSGSTMERA
jgi:hypothetical protein